MNNTINSSVNANQELMSQSKVVRIKPTRVFETHPKISKINPFLTKEEQISLAKGWSATLHADGWACPRWNMVYTLLRGKSIEDAFTPITNTNKLLENKNPWNFVDYRMQLLLAVGGRYNKEDVLTTWFKPWIGILSETILFKLIEELKNPTPIKETGGSEML